MTKLSKTQRLILKSAAIGRHGAVLPLPENLKLRGGALKTSLASLQKRGLVAIQGSGKNKHLVITAKGRAMVATDDGAPSAHDRDHKTNNQGAASNTRTGTKRAQINALVQRGQGASIAELTEATGWQPHSIRAALTGLRKQGANLTRTKNQDGVSTYRVAKGTPAHGQANQG